VLRIALYSVFGLGVIGLYGVSMATGGDMSSVPTTHGAVPAEYRASGAWRTSPMVWRTGFHGPAAYVPPTVDTGSSGGSGSGGAVGVGYYGGFGGGK
jgi:hypothetical protein